MRKVELQRGFLWLFEQVERFAEIPSPFDLISVGARRYLFEGLFPLRYSFDGPFTCHSLKITEIIYHSIVFSKILLTFLFISFIVILKIK